MHAEIEVLLAKIDLLRLKIEVLPLEINLLPPTIDILPTKIDVLHAGMEVLHAKINLLPEKISLLHAGMEVLQTKIESSIVYCARVAGGTPAVPVNALTLPVGRIAENKRRGVLFEMKDNLVGQPEWRADPIRLV